MDTRRFLSASRSLIVAGKGGTGKSTVAQALATVATSAGMSVLLVGIDTERPPEPTVPGIDTLGLTAGSALSEYLSARGLGIVTRQLDRLGIVSLVASTAPGIDDLLVLGKLKQLVRDDPHDIVIVDGPAAGHAVDLLRAPRILGRTVSGGPIAEQAAGALAMLADAAAVRVLLVTRPAATPVSETVETARQLERDLAVALGPVVVNGVHGPSPVSPEGQSAHVRAAAEYCIRRHRAESEAIGNLVADMGPALLSVSHHSGSTRDIVSRVSRDLEAAIGGLPG